jgi:hypothetical protein
VGSKKLPYCKVDKGENMNSGESLYQQGVLTGEDKIYILIIGGIEVFLPSSPVEEKACVAEAEIEDRQPTKIFMEE